MDRIDRRSLLRARLHRAPPMRPPWAIAEPGFIDRCDRCGACIERCRRGLLRRGSGGFPEADLSEGGCDFCGACLDACTTGALCTPRPTVATAWNQRARIEPHCLALQGTSCRICGDDCAAVAIRFRLETGGRALPQIDAARCTGCGECRARCPVAAIGFYDLQQALCR